MKHKKKRASLLILLYGKSKITDTVFDKSFKNIND